MRLLLSTAKVLGQSSCFRFSELNKFQNNFLSTTNLAYIESLYEKWTVDKNSVSKSFHAFFELVDQGEDPEIAFQRPLKNGESFQTGSSSNQVAQQLKMRLMIDRYRNVGHHFARIDPLELQRNQDLHGRLKSGVLSLQNFGYSQQSLSQQIKLKNLRDEGEGAIKQHGPYTIKAMEEYLQKVYCDKVGFEYMHLLDKEERDFIKRQIEDKIQSLEKNQPNKAERLQTLRRLCKDQCFIDVLGSKFGNFKRFGIEGLNASISGLGQLVESAAQSGTQDIVFGMAHRGRLNTLHCVFQKSAQTIFRQFLQKKDQVDHDTYSGDVKYHLGYVSKKKFGDKQITLSILPNPSHLQAVNPLIYGSVRALQQFKGDSSKQKVVGVLIHGDAAMSGQGVVYESLQMQDLVDYTTGGIIHIVLNNQIGFTTNPKQGRSSFYCTQIAKVVDSPVLHVNGDEPDILDRCMKIAVAYRKKFKKDFFIDIVGYRRFGHNEQDQPLFTQPLMYEKIKHKNSVYETYSKKLLEKGAVTLKQLQDLKQHFTAQYEEDYRKVMSDKHDQFKQAELQISRIRTVNNAGGKTGVAQNTLAELFTKISHWPEQFNIHPTIKKIYEERIKHFTHHEPLDWATMESLAYASLLNEGYKVRLSGQDVERGTFSHRHAMVSDQKRDVEKHCFLKAVSKNDITVSNSHLSQFGVMGFQYGYSITNPNALVIWEAQFGDFANGASTIIDNFLVSGQTKWHRHSGLVLNLPHGMDGQGPEHSQGRIQRFLHLSDDNCDVEQQTSYQAQIHEGNIQVVCVSTTSNYFHAMRRQLKRNFRKPLIMFNSKKLLKFKGANRPITDILQGTQFQTVYPDESGQAPQKISKVLICHGQFYYELKVRRQELKRNDVAIVRIEQIAPFPHQHLKKILSVYGPKVEYLWVQQEHQNYGAWTFLEPRLRLLLGKRPGFRGRKASGSTAVGALKLHKKQQQVLLAQIFAV